MKYLLVIANYKDYRQEFFDNHISPRNKEYCKKHNFEYIELKDDLKPIRGKLGWIKAFKVCHMLNNELKENDILTCLDADMAIHKIDFDYTTNKSFSYSIDSGNTHCMGSYSVKVNDWTKNLFNLITCEERYKKLNKPSLHPAFNSFDSFWESHYDQASWYSLAGIVRHSWVPFFNLPNSGWHTDKNEDTVFCLKELYDNVEILPTKWNVTEMPGESDCHFNINPVERKDVIIRHFAGQQKWREEWLN
jgi:hypothetical protein